MHTQTQRKKACGKYVKHKWMIELKISVGVNISRLPELCCNFWNCLFLAISSQQIQIRNYCTCFHISSCQVQILKCCSTFWPTLRANGLMTNECLFHHYQDYRQEMTNLRQEQIQATCVTWSLNSRLLLFFSNTKIFYISNSNWGNQKNSVVVSVL